MGAPTMRLNRRDLIDVIHTLWANGVIKDLEYTLNRLACQYVCIVTIESGVQYRVVVEEIASDEHMIDSVRTMK
jgi:hypothetical protein